MNANKDYWFLLKPYAHISFDNKGKMLIYNTQNGNYIESKNKDFIALINSAREKKNLGVTLVSKKMFSKKVLHDNIMKATEMQIIELLPVCESSLKPISLQPILNVQRAVERLKNNAERFISEDIMQYLTSLNLYINAECKQNCLYCTSYYKQFLCCTRCKETSELPMNVIESIIKQTSHLSLGKINILGGNILIYRDIVELINLLTANDHLISYFWIHYSSLLTSNSALLRSIRHKNIIMDYLISDKDLDKVLSIVDINTKLYFIIENETQLKKIDSIFRYNKDLNIEIRPFYNGKNLNFFKKYVFLQKSDILSNLISQREIFRNQVLNLNYFGAINIFSDGTVRATPTSKKIGNIYQNSILELLAYELDENTAWRNVRNGKPCNECLYQYLCPPLSNYEEVIGKINLCFIE